VTVLQAQGVVAGYGERTVLHGCDLTLGEGQLIAIVGPNGAGKSTLLRVLAGLIRPTSGRVTLDAADLSALSRGDIARRIAVVPQVIETLFPFSVREIVALGRTARLGFFGRATAEDAAAIERATEELDLGSLASRRVDTLSGGERQRAVIAMALAQEADVLLLDEPTVHLDPGHQIATLELVRTFAAKRGLAVGAVLHDLNLASSFASRIVVIADGRVAREGSPAEVLRADLLQAVFGAGLEVVTRNGHPAVLPRVSTPE
jgi:iron complex transport system ATP-binding protein